MAPKILMIGWHPSAVNYAKYPGLTPEKLEAGLRADEASLKALGYNALLAFIHSAETAASDLESLLDEGGFDVVMIGAGVRNDDDHLVVFEKLFNDVHEHAPKARIAFNSGPHDSAVAIKRWA